MAQDDYIRTALRVPPDLHKEIHAAASKAGRSFNAQLLYLLEKGLKSPDGFIPAPKSVISIDSDGKYQEKSPKELFAEMTELITRASLLASIFESHADGPPEMPDMTNAPDWAVDRAQSPDISISHSDAAAPKLKRRNASKSG